MKYNENFAQKFVSSFIGKKKEEVKEKIPHIKKMLEDIRKVTDDKWGVYAFRREPLRGKFTEEERASLIERANECGRTIASTIRGENTESSVYEIAEKLGIEVDYPDKPVGGGHIIFAQFVHPNKVSIFKDSIDKSINLIKKEKLESFFDGVNIEEILLAHEIFHFIEENNEDIYSRSEKVRLWKIGPFKNDSDIVCLGEIAGMAFAKELLKLQFSPYVLDVFLVFLYYPEVAFGLYKEIMSIEN